MAQKTMLRKIDSGEAPAGRSYQFLASAHDQRELLYQYDPPLQPSPVELPPPPPPPPKPPQLTPQLPVQPAPGTAPVKDCALSGLEVVRILIARKLMKSMEEVPTSKSIKDLCGGKSTLQNELVGDLHAEFGLLPDRPEDIPLKDLGIILDPSRPLGKVSSALVARLIASKMPGGFGIASIHNYLEQRLGLSPKRQTAVTLWAVAAEPTSRLPDNQAAERYWDQIAQDYGAFCGINLQPRSQQLQQASNDAASARTVLVDSSAFNQASEAHKRLATKQYHALAEYLVFSSSDSSSSDKKLVTDLQLQLDTWSAEFSDEFLSGIAPTFDAGKARQYTSWWNYAREEVLTLYHSGQLHDKMTMETLINRLASRANGPLSLLVSHLAEECPSEVLRELFQRVVRASNAGVKKPPVARPMWPTAGPRTIVTEDGDIGYVEIPRPGFSGPAAYGDYLSHRLAQPRETGDSPVIRVNAAHADHEESDWTKLFIQGICDALTTGVSFSEKSMLVTGAGQGSIGSEVIRILLAGGARVIVTTSREPSTVAGYFQSIYRDHGAKGSELHLLQFNQASSQDCERLIDHLYSQSWDLDAILPFAAAPEGGAEMDALSPTNELAHRLMLTNVFRLLGRIVKNKRRLEIACHPTQVVLPLSPNHGIFGGDGLYSESKLGLESLVNRARSESWSDQLSICGVEIGWTRSTGLMTANDVLAETIENHGVLTFSAQEMALNIAVLLTSKFVDLCEDGPIYADFGGGLSTLGSCHAILSKAREEFRLAADVARAVKTEDEREQALLKGTKSSIKRPFKQKTMLRVGFPKLPDTLPDHDIGRLVDPARTVVVVGFSELGPWGNARLRWEMETFGQLSPDGYVEMAWLMGLIRHVDEPCKGGHYVGWVDAKTGEPVDDNDVRHKYGEFIKAHTGIRFVEPDTITGYDPACKELLQEVAVEEDLPPFETSLSTAEALQLKHGDKVVILRLQGNSDSYQVQIKRGATILVPKAVPFPWGSVAGLLPSGWDAARYGIPKDIIQQVDPVTLYTLCCVAEAFYSAGVPDPTEVFQHIHLSELGNFIGSSMGGVLKTRHLYRDAYLDQDIQADTLQDTYLNTTPAWINMLLLGAAGPIKTPVGACATGLESIDSAMDSIMAGKTKMCLVGGYDDFGEEESLGFAKMKATVDVAAELARGRLPSEMSRPTAESRAGFVESHGCGVQLLCRADVALEMGLPIYGVIAGSATAADGIGRSVPAPGQGILTFAGQAEQHMPLYTQLSIRNDSFSSGSSSEPELWTPVSEKAGSKSTSSSIGAALGAWGLTINDLDVASLHGTSTKANDLNEPEVIHKQMTHLGRTDGGPLWAICQKSITGHPKAPAAAWMMNGCLQVLDSGLVPGNRNADNIDPALKAYHHLCFPTRTVRMAGEGPKAFLLTSFGFGQKSGQVVGVAPRFFFGSLPASSFAEYCGKTKARQAKADRAFAKAVMENQVVKVKTEPLYVKRDASRIYLDRSLRVGQNDITGAYQFATVS
ncbi:uncharacterized protein PODANS_2_7310 [Podospora anserina S mat+]|uniref:Fatty acid synthase subunit alpha involved in aflatoxin biosynthesis orthologous to A. nidulans stcJ, member of the aflatoxin cluster n=1 Tax=Podospora anserina (strain S / ATCC MYA-4624 / DSM 980 / FGSC 10383) TaxID=515849 RepID=B2B6B8_PODAN|nr:uncharacterized protein PODANS_2_7310 [Podospora anserina S mat+]CAP73343.1 unnamed protein product [Podospora anserina S mat+]CDP25747.1 Putative fatty acid synthase subunit alpha involved in aflatoxin biosynthesis orthologous to A. nidulans stcJ, member of the aflatoxin cluster [Podospora anserina S mat+]